ncbi:MAG: DUF885 domain-containing protein [Thermoanaerobaculia bacterium]
MKARAFLLVLVFVLALLAPSAAGAVDPGLVDAARRLEAFPATKGQGSESERLKAFFDLFWSARMRAFPDFASYIGYPGVYDLLPDFSAEGLALVHRLSRLDLAALESIDRSRLTPAEQLNYDLARRRFAMEIEGERFHGTDPFHNDFLLVEPMNNRILSALGLLAYMPARTVQDFEAMLTRLRGFPRLVDDGIARLDEGLKRGITPPRAVMREPGEVKTEELEAEVLAPFEKIPETVPATERERLRSEAGKLFREQVAPAVRKLDEYLAKTYIPGTRQAVAVTALPDGKAWYAYRLRFFTTTDLTPDEIHRLGLSEVARIRKEMDAAIAGTGFKGSYEEFCRFLRTDPRFFYDKPEDLVAGYRDITKRIDPGLIKLFGRLPRLPYGVTPISSASSPAGFYANGSLAAGQPGWFQVNEFDLKARPKWAMEALALHESVPGHHLQYALAEELEHLPYWRKWDIYPAFSEGWGLYAESLGSELGLYQDPYSDFGRLTFEIWRALRMVVDTGLHAKGWTREQAVEYYRANSARSDQEIQVEIDRALGQPGSLPAYKVGELKIKELRAYAERELGPRFDLRAFHDHLIGDGQLPLDLLERNVKAWVGNLKASPLVGAEKERDTSP